MKNASHRNRRCRPRRVPRVNKWGAKQEGRRHTHATVGIGRLGCHKETATMNSAVGNEAAGARRNVLSAWFRCGVEEWRRRGHSNKSPPQNRQAHIQLVPTAVCAERRSS